MKIRKLLTLITVHFVFAIVFYGCCKEKAQIDGISDLMFRDIDFTLAADTVRGDFSIECYFSYQLVEAFVPNMNTLNATSCDHQVNNPVDTNTLEIRFDKSFMVEGTEIPANSNIMANTLVRSYMLLNAPDYDPFVEVEFKSPFFDVVEFEQTDYEMELKIKTSDDVQLEGSTSAYFNL